MQKTGKRWIASSIIKLRNTSWDKWENRNAALHNTPIAADLSGAVSLNLVIRSGCRLGRIELSRIVKSVFPKDENKFL